METKTLEMVATSESSEDSNRSTASLNGNEAAAPPRLRALYPWMAGALLALFFLQLGIHLTRTSVTYDEKVFILAGYRYWKCGNYTINPAHPPLSKLVAAFPLRSKALVDAGNGCSALVPSIYDGYLQAAQFLVANGIDSVVIPARWAETSFSLLLGLAMLFGIKRMFGWQEALVALALLACEPVLIAHGSIATTDMAVTATFFLAVFAFYLFCEKPTMLRGVALGLSIGATLACKHPALAALSLFWILLPVSAWIAQRSQPKQPAELRLRFLRTVLGFVFALALGWACLWATYGFRYYALPNAHQETMPFASLPVATSGLAAQLEPVVHLMRTVHLFPESYLYGLADILQENSTNAMVLLGNTYPHGRWFYFPIAFSIKTSLPLLILLLLALFQSALYRKRPREMAFLLIPAFGYFMFGMASGLDVGIRHILPVYPFFVAIAAAGTCVVTRRFPRAWALVVALLAFGAVDSARTLPNDIAFSNELWGGTNNTYKFLSDSNVDWGQNLKEVRSYIEAHHIQQCWIAANGTPEVALATLPCRLLPAPFQWMDRPMDDIPSTIEGTVFLSNETLPAEFPGVYSRITRNKPSDLLGGATFVYTGRFDVKAAAVLVHETNSSFFYAHHQLPQAIEELQQGIALEPDDPGPHFAMGMYLLAEGQTVPARAELTQCVGLAARDPNASGLRELAERQLQSIK
jgi:4-amino-4-deoxy-L-arabinose transferase-like glycosyltransferase